MLGTSRITNLKYTYPTAIYILTPDRVCVCVYMYVKYVYVAASELLI